MVLEPNQTLLERHGGTFPFLHYLIKWSQLDLLLWKELILYSHHFTAGKTTEGFRGRDQVELFLPRAWENIKFSASGIIREAAKIRILRPWSSWFPRQGKEKLERPHCDLLEGHAASNTSDLHYVWFCVKLTNLDIYVWNQIFLLSKFNSTLWSRLS